MKTKQNKKQKRFYKSSAQVLNPVPIMDIVEKNTLSFPSRKSELYGLEKAFGMYEKAFGMCVSCAKRSGSGGRGRRALS